MEKEGGKEGKMEVKPTGRAQATPCTAGRCCGRGLLRNSENKRIWT